MCEPLFQIGRTPIKPLDLDLSQRLERRTHERRSIQDVLNEADRRHQCRRFDDKRSKQ